MFYLTLAGAGAYNIVFDHNSFTWSTDQTINTWGSNVHDITWSWNIVAEGGGGGTQNTGSLFGGSSHYNIMLHHNYLAHQWHRNYMVAAHGYNFINNVNYNTTNWDYHLEQGYGDAGVVDPDIINHYFKEGPNTNRHFPFDLIAVTHSGGPMSIYLNGNKYVDKNGSLVYGPNDQWSMANEPGRISCTWCTMPTYEKRFQPHSTKPQFPVTIQSADAGKDLVLANAGPRLPKLDAVDTRLLGDFFDGGGYDENNIGKFPNLKTYNVPQDNDNDGIPDDWEVAHGLNPNDGTDHNKDRDGDGYTNIEEWINSIGRDFSPSPVNLPPRNLVLRYLGPTPSSQQCTPSCGAWSDSANQCGTSSCTRADCSTYADTKSCTGGGGGGQASCTYTVAKDGTGDYTTIQAAANAAGPGDVVCVGPGIYTDEDSDNWGVVISRSGTPNNPITFRSINKWGAVIDGGPNFRVHSGINVGASYIRIEDFEIKRWFYGGIWCGGGTHNYYRGNHIHHIGNVLDPETLGKVGFWQAPGCKSITYDSNIVHDIGRLPGSTYGATAGHDYNHDHGIYATDQDPLSPSANDLVINNIWYSNKAGWHVLFGKNYKNARIINNTFIGPNPVVKGNGLFLDGDQAGGLDTFEVANNIFYHMNTFAVMIKDHVENLVTMKNNLIYPDMPLNQPEGYPDWPASEGPPDVAENNIFGQDPLMVNPNNPLGGGFKLQSNSPAIDAGTSKDAPFTDFEGTPRPQGSAWDIGADEF